MIPPIPIHRMITTWEKPSTANRYDLHINIIFKVVCISATDIQDELKMGMFFGASFLTLSTSRWCCKMQIHCFLMDSIRYSDSFQKNWIDERIKLICEGLRMENPSENESCVFHIFWLSSKMAQSFSFSTHSHFYALASPYFITGKFIFQTPFKTFHPACRKSLIFSLMGTKKQGRWWKFQ